MAAVEQTVFPALSAMGLVKTPPLVHPSALARAAEYCAEFGGNREALEAAALAGALIEARMLHAQRSAAAAPAPGILQQHTAMVTNPVLPTSSTMAPSLPFPSPPGLAVTPEVSDQMKQAMAAAEATNTKPKAASQQDSVPQPPPPAPEMPVEMPMTAPAVGTLPQAVHAVPPVPNAPPVPSLGTTMVPPLGQAMAAMAQGMAFATGLPPPMLQHPLTPMNPMLMSMPPPAQVQPPAPPPTPPPTPRPPHQLIDKLDVREAREPPPQPPQQLQPPPSPQKDSSQPKLERPKPADESEPVRCHLHRKPQSNCKICRRLHFSSLTGDGKKADIKNDASGGGDGQTGLEEAGPRRQILEAFEVTNKQTYNFNAMLRDQILKSTYFKSLMNVETFEGVVDQLYEFADTAEVYGQGSVAGNTVPSTLFCCLFRFFTIGVSYDELHQLLNNRDSAFIRCCGFLYIRFGCAPEKLWDHMGEYCLDDAVFEPSKSQPNVTITMGEYVEALLMDERYYYTNLPRIPVATKKKLDEKVAPLLQYRRRTMANKRDLSLFRSPGTTIEACIEGEWQEAVSTALLEGTESRIMMRCRLEGSNEEVVAHIGKIILRERGRRGRSRSRSRSPHRGRSPDWSRHKGKSDAELVQDLRARQRERAVCSSGKDYARKPIGFMSGLALKRDVGIASSRLREEETYAPKQVEKRKQLTEEEEMEARKQERARLEMDRELQLRQQQLFEKYGTNNPKDKVAPKDAPTDSIEAPDVLRLG